MSVMQNEHWSLFSISPKKQNKKERIHRYNIDICLCSNLERQTRSGEERKVYVDEENNVYFTSKPNIYNLHQQWPLFYHHFLQEIIQNKI